MIAGAWAPGRLVLLEFESLARAEAWYDSPAYTEARAIRQRASTGTVVLAEGVGPAQGSGEAYAIARHGAGDPGLGSAAAHSGRVLVSAGAAKVKESGWVGAHARVSVIEFADRSEATAWSGSVADRQAAGGVVLVEGV